ncbi:DUF2130 domain-containing protein [Caldichromatium japonicum]|uniref:DUF2130 domain-containing protein n=1 Tax=Caldichromatium japonicum TaxID=2699430 RepID=A0A6G7VCT5_9GAMM|nr:DUF2130 domain-containing protein [Caldichromatium japonicum]QIK37668.1 DUF2130 domain-containing protein [Caldichromatium japonicum]
MTELSITCPRCEHSFTLNEGLSAQVRASLEAEQQARIQATVREAEQRAQAKLQTLERLLAEYQARIAESEARTLALQQKALELEQARQQEIERARLETEERLRCEFREHQQVLIAQAEQRVRASAERERQALEARLAAERETRERAQQSELALRQQAAALEARAQMLDLEVARQVAAQRADWETHVRQMLTAEQDLKLKEKDKQLEDLRRVIADLQRKSEQGSQELQGEVLELDIQAALAQRFPLDEVAPVPKGVAGADLIQTVKNHRGQVCGRIVWETKNTKHWSITWIPKLKDDLRAAGGNLAVLVSTVLPDGVYEFGLIDGVWVASRRTWPALAVALREQLIQVAFAQAAAEGRQEKMAAVYDYLASDAFRQRVAAIVESLTALQDQLNRERRAMEKLWKEREKQVERAIFNTVGIYGELRGLLGGGLPEIAALSLEGIAGLLGP